MSATSGELQVPCFADGTFLHELDDEILDLLEEKRFLFFVKHVGISGTYFCNSHTCTSLASDYSYIENVRTIDKAIRGIYTNILPSLNGPVYVDATTGKLRMDVVKFYEDLAGQALEQMNRDGELSGFAVSLDPDQDILTSGELEFVIQKVPVGVARKMKVKIGFTTKLS
jgi:hypothetical protein